jgi:hypothetical protein
MDPAKVVVGDVERDGRRVVFSFLEKPLVSRVKRRLAIRTDRFWRST